jgi:lipopolysaccharide export system protein LptA
MFHPVLPPQPPPNLVSSKPVSDLAATAVIQVKNDQQKLIIDGKNQQGRYQSTTKPVNDSPLSRLENSGWEFSIIQGQKRKIIHIIAGQQVLTGTSTPPVEKNYVNLQESGGKVDLLVGEKTPSLPVQNLIEFKLRNPQNQENQESKPGNLQVPPLPQISEAKKISPQKTRIVEVIADRQEYDQERRIVTAEGNVVVRFDGTVIDADTLHINLDNLMAVGEGNVALTRGNQIFQGQRFTYNFIQDSGDLENGKGELYIPTTATDFAFSPSLPTDITAGGVPSRPLSYRLRANQPLTGVNSPGGIEFGASGQSDARNVSVPKSGGVLKRLRFEAQYIEFYPRGFQAQDVRITNDPFSPPELEIRAAKVTVTREAPLIDRVTTQGQRLVFDQKVVVPIPVNSRKIDRRPRQVNPTIVSVGFDNGKRGGLFIERAFEPINNDQTRWTITPQFYVQRAVENGGNLANLFGVNTKLNAVLSPKTVVEGTGELTSFDFDQVEDTLRGSLRLRQSLGNVKPYTLSLESSYRDRLYNGSLGYQTVQSSIGGIITSPSIPLGKSGIELSYQGGAQYINSNTDRQDLLSPLRKNDRISLGRFQGSVSLSSGIKLWEGKPLPATAKEGLKYTSNPVVPYLQAIAGITGTTSYYSSGDNQGTVTGTIGLIGQIGHFSRPFLDYTGFNVSYSQGTNSGLSPFLFDRSVDNKVLSAGISQQVYGPIRLGLQTSINLDTSKEISTDYTLEYSRRTHGITLRYNPVLQLGGFSIRISDFNWTGGTDPFANGQVKPVVGGVVREEN